MDRSFSYTPDLSDLRAIVRAVLVRSAGRSRLVLVTLVLMLSISSLLLESWWPLGLLVFWVAWFFLIVEVGARKSYRKNVPGGRQIEVNFSDEALITVTNQLRTELYLLHNAGGRVGTAIPKRAFSSPEIERSFLEAARRGMARTS